MGEVIQEAHLDERTERRGARPKPLAVRCSNFDRFPHFLGEVLYVPRRFSSCAGDRRISKLWTIPA